MEMEATLISFLLHTNLVRIPIAVSGVLGGLLFRRLVFGLFITEMIREPAQPGVHIADQENCADHEQQDHHEAGRPSQAAAKRVAEVVVGQNPAAHGVAPRRSPSTLRRSAQAPRTGSPQHSAISRTPANRSSSGTVESTNERASSKSSVGQTAF